MALLYGLSQLKSAETEFMKCWSAKDPLSPETVKQAYHAMILLCTGSVRRFRTSISTAANRTGTPAPAAPRRSRPEALLVDERGRQNGHEHGHDDDPPSQALHLCR